MAKSWAIVEILVLVTLIFAIGATEIEVQLTARDAFKFEPWPKLDRECVNSPSGLTCSR